jgi:DNA-binding NarL/FixJ family response regulator
MPAVIEQYVDWLVKVYTGRFGRPPAGSDVAARAAAILRSHAARVPAGDEFVSLAAAETADRLSDPDANLDEPFLRTLDKAADAARHRAMREARRWHTNLTDLGQVPTPPPADDAAVERIKAELFESLSVEEHSIVERMLAGEPVADLARHLGVSRRTLYRRIGQIKRRLEGRSG